ncbi:MAG TPA: SIMPL domain-containing protein [Pyrinomonadaceae bacterium]|nr:SIMPL domain-containing protein [Pyrinomonadaceae bacterium]
METKSGSWLNSGTTLGIGLIIAALVFGWFYSSAKRGDEAITVTGSAKRRISSDLVVWQVGTSASASDLNTAYRQVSETIPKLKAYLVSKGIPEEQLVVQAIVTQTLKRRDSDGNETGEITGYSLSQQIEVRSNDVQRIAQVSRESTELLNQGLLVESSAPKYYYTKLGDLKVEMLGEAAKDAKERAEKIASSTGSSVGSVRSARMGVLQITAADSTDVSDYGVYDTSTIEKDITAVVNISFTVK